MTVDYTTKQLDKMNIEKLAEIMDSKFLHVDFMNKEEMIEQIVIKQQDQLNFKKAFAKVIEQKLSLLEK